jgi:hypothetical protein
VMPKKAACISSSAYAGYLAAPRREGARAAMAGGDPAGPAHTALCVLCAPIPTRQVRLGVLGECVHSGERRPKKAV